MASLELKKVEKKFGQSHVVKGVDLVVEPGEFVVILGPSGCGKSTLLRMVAGLEAITAGSILINNKIVNELEPRERGCAMVFQNYALYPHMSVAENIGYALKVAGLSKADREKKIHTVAQTLGLTEFLERKPSQLSGGQRQRVAMGRAMIREPAVFLYDEPLSNLDAKLRVSMRGEIRRLHQRLGTTSLFVTHDQIEAMTLADRIVVMNEGKIEQIATPHEIYNKPASLFVADFVGSPGFNLIEGVYDSSQHAFVGSGGSVLSLDRAKTPTTLPPRLIMGFRAECAVVTGEGRDPSFRVDYIEDLGATKHVQGFFDDQKIIIAVKGDEALPSGSDFRLKIKADDLHFFDPMSGRRVVQ
ncbi:MAG: sn-glycerol-3-phosphate ABC transporter ATP-binding protein UgpC [Hyphomicrobiales bacterium]|nr:sn-glycerol-3-phosphate ABC transporter ATP-binding protein UgpC [Hyphomicrobiales bacterium]